MKKISILLFLLIIYLGYVLLNYSDILVGNSSIGSVIQVLTVPVRQLIVPIIISVIIYLQRKKGKKVNWLIFLLVVYSIIGLIFAIFGITETCFELYSSCPVRYGLEAFGYLPIYILSRFLLCILVILVNFFPISEIVLIVIVITIIISKKMVNKR